MNLPNPVHATRVRLFIAALSLMCIPALAQTVVAKPAPTPSPLAAPAPAPEPIATPAPEPAATPASGPTVTATPAPGGAMTAAPADATTVSASPTSSAADSTHGQMTQINTSMTDNMAKNEATDAAMKSHSEAQQAGAKSDMEMKHAMIAQMQTMSDQIAQLNDRVTAHTAQLAPPVVPVKAKPAKAKVRPPIILPNPPQAH